MKYINLKKNPPLKIVLPIVAAAFYVLSFLKNSLISTMIGVLLLFASVLAVILHPELIAELVTASVFSLISVF